MQQLGNIVQVKWCDYVIKIITPFNLQKDGYGVKSV